MKRNLRGMTLTELAIVLGAMGLIMGAVWAIVGTVWDGYRFQKLKQQIQTVSQAVQDYYGPMNRINTGSDGDDITAAIDGLGLIPIDMRSDRAVAGNLIHSAGGTFFVERLSSATFRINVGGLKKELCIRLLIEFPVIVPEVGVIRFASGGGDTAVNANNIVSPGGAQTLPLPPSTAASWCNALTNEVDIDFKILK